MKTFLKLALAALLLVLLLLGIAWLTLTRQWPWWVGAALALGTLGLIALAILLVHHARRRRERRFVQRVVSEDLSRAGKAPVREVQVLQDLQARWMEGIGLLRQSFLRQRGNPLYVLPWYVVIGESGAGKSSAIALSGLTSILGQRRREGPIASTRNCEWWFFEQGIVLDTAGRYTIPIDEELDREEWRRFLTLLAKYRRREPINGVVVVVPADQVLAGDAAKLREDALDIRRRLDHIMRSQGAKVPVYLMVTKMDRVLGMTALAAALEDRAGQAMGWANVDQEPHCELVVEAAMDAVGQRLRQLRYELVREKPEAGAGLLLLPAEFERLRPGLSRFVRALFQETSYLETPPLRGIYFSAAVPGAEPASEFMATSKLRECPGPWLGDGAFLRDFFTLTMPRDRHLHQPIREFLEWARIRRNLALLAWTCLWLGAIGLLGASFTHNLRAIRAFSAGRNQGAQLTEDIGKDLLHVDRMRLDVMAMKRANRGWWIPRMGLDQSLRAERAAQNAWLAVFRGGLLEPLDAVERRLADAGSSGKDGWVGAYTGYLATRIALLQARVEGRADLDDPPEILPAFTQAAAGLLLHLHPDMSREMAQLYGPNYLANVAWFGNRAERAQKLAELRWNLAQVLSRQDNDLRWMASSWVPMAPSVELSDFWGAPERTFEDRPSVPGAFTREGRKNLRAFTDLLEGTLHEGGDLQGKVSRFWEWYGHQHQAAWLAFAKRFAEGDLGLVSTVARQRMATLMATPRNPYFALLGRMAVEEESLKEQAPAPWMTLLGQINRVRDLADQQILEKGNASTLEKLELERRKQVDSWEGKLDPRKSKDFDLCMTASKSWMEYLAGLHDIGATLLSRSGARRQMVAVFGGANAEEGPQGASPFLKARGGILAMEVLLGSDNASRTVWDLVRGPLDHTMAFSLEETAADLQEQWEQTVLASLRERGQDPGQVHKILFNPQDGKVWAFVKGPAKPFVARTPAGYVPRRAFNRLALPFSQDFYAFLNASDDSDSIYQASFTVTLEALPLEVNPGAKATPTSSRLCLQTPEGGRTCLENYNFNTSATFKWEPETSGEATLEIQLPSLTLTRSWPGPSGFALFLKDLSTGARQYAATEFPQSAEKLQALGIDWIRVAYRIQGGDKVLRFLQRAPTSVPRDIVATTTED